MPVRSLTALLLATTLTAACAAVEQPTPTPAQPTPPTEPTPPVEPTPPTEPTSPTEPTPPVEPTPPTEPTAPTEPTPFEPPAIAFEQVAGGFSDLTQLTHSGEGAGGQIYVVEQRGVIHVGGPEGAFVPEPFLDISDRVDFGGERGLLGLAFHPDFAHNHRFFINYIGSDGDTVVSEFRRIPGCACADPASERILLTIGQPFGNHNGGALVFGPDGMLYISTGDGGSAGDPLNAGQDLAMLLGKVLRIDIDAAEPYAIPPDNPFVGTDGARPEIWAYGLRNPWRISFDRQTGDLFIADVGQDRWEEINAEPAGTGGRNYGWRIMEGPDCYDPPQDCDRTGLTLPVAWYPTGAGCAVMGGYVYRGPGIADLVGGYLFADHCSGNVWAIDAALAIRATQGEAEIPVPIHELGNAGINVTGFGQDETGRLYLVGAGGEVLRVAAVD